MDKFSDFKKSLTDIAHENNLSLPMLREFIKKFDDFGLNQEIKYFYPKGIYTEKNMILVFFYDDKIVTVEFIEDECFNISRLSKVESINLKVKANSEGQREIRINFESDETIVLNSTKDTNSAWKDNFTKNIDNIYEHLI